MQKQSNLIALPFSENLTPTSYTLPENLSAEQWLDVGVALGKVRGSTMWWIGDWWAYGEHAYGERANAVRANEWEGPAYQTCIDAGVVSRKFETKSRDLVVSWRFHRAIGLIADESWRLKILEWASKPNGDGKRPTFSAIEERVREVKAHLAQGWTPDQLDRKAIAERGECVVANIREDNGRRKDEALLAWAESQDRFVRIDRKTEWGNPFEMPDDGDRDAVVLKFSKFYFPNKNGLMRKIPSLSGKVLGCWCHPETCHGHIIAGYVNQRLRNVGKNGS